MIVPVAKPYGDTAAIGAKAVRALAHKLRKAMGKRDTRYALVMAESIQLEGPRTGKKPKQAGYFKAKVLPYRASEAVEGAKP